jgi:hypothetical protein
MASFSVSCWVRRGDNTGSSSYIIKKNAGWTEANGWGFDYSVAADYPHLGLTAPGVPASLQKNVWGQMVMVVNRTTQFATMYVNGVAGAPRDISAVASQSNGYKLMIAKCISQPSYYFGQLDEIQVSTAAWTTGWVQTTYNNQNNPSSFITLGSETNRYIPKGIIIMIR